jgi:hypothetical protein
LWWPGFNPVTGSYVANIPVHSVATEVQCEMYAFLDKEAKNPSPKGPLLDESRGATVTLKLTTDLSGSVAYVGINLAKLGVPSLSSLVAVTNKIPTLQAKGNVKSTLAAEIDFVVAQSKKAPISKPAESSVFLPKEEVDYITRNSIKFVNATFEQEKNSTLFAVQPNTAGTPSHPRFYPATECYRRDLVSVANHSFFYLFLDDWLVNFKRSEQKYPKFVCNSKLTLTTAFTVGLDVSAGVNAFLTPPLILPISGLNIDANPDYVHQLTVSFALKDNDEKHARYCKGIEGTQPSQINP